MRLTALELTQTAVVAATESHDRIHSSCQQEVIIKV